MKTNIQTVTDQTLGIHNNSARYFFNKFILIEIIIQKLFKFILFILRGAKILELERFMTQPYIVLV